MIGEARSRNQKKLEQYMDLVRETCAAVSRTTKAGFHVNITQDYACFHVPSDSSCIQRLEYVFGQMGIPMRVEEGGGGMDANRLNANGIECVGLATGYAKNHGTNEELQIEDLILAGEMVEKTVFEVAQEELSAGQQKKKK